MFCALLSCTMWPSSRYIYHIETVVGVPWHYIKCLFAFINKIPIGNVATHTDSPPSESELTISKESSVKHLTWYETAARNKRSLFECSLSLFFVAKPHVLVLRKNLRLTVLRIWRWNWSVRWKITSCRAFSLMSFRCSYEKLREINSFAWDGNIYMLLRSFSS